MIRGGDYTESFKKDGREATREENRKKIQELRKTIKYSRNQSLGAIVHQKVGAKSHNWEKAGNKKSL